MHSRFEEPYYAKDECWDASTKFVLYAQGQGQAELKVVGVGDTQCYKRYCCDKTGHWAVAAGEWRIDFTARQFHKWFAFPRVWKETKKQGKHDKMDQSKTTVR